MKKETSSPRFLTIDSYRKLLRYQTDRSLSLLTKDSLEIVCQPSSNPDTIIQLIPIATLCYPVLNMLMSVASSRDFVLKYTVISEKRIYVSLRVANTDQRATAPIITLLLFANPKQHDKASCTITARAGYMVYQTQNYILDPKTLLTTLLTTLLAALYCQNYTLTSLSDLFFGRQTTWGLENMRFIRRLSRFANPKNFLKYYLRAATIIPNIPRCRIVFKMRYFPNAEAMASYALLQGSSVILSFYSKILKILETSKNN